MRCIYKTQYKINCLAYICATTQNGLKDLNTAFEGTVFFECSSDTPILHYLGNVSC